MVYTRKVLFYPPAPVSPSLTHAVILTDSMNLLQKVESGMGCPDWHTAMHSLRATKTSVDLLSWARRSQWE